MRWIGQHIYDQISRFRNAIYLEDISTGTIASGAHLGLDSNNKIVKAADGGGDLTGITAGTGLSGTSLTGPVPTLNVDASQTQITSVGTITTGVWRGTQIQIISANFKGDQGTTETFLPLSAQPEEKTSFGNEQNLLLMPTGGNVKEIIVRANYNAYTSENIVFKVYTRAANKKVNGSSQVGSDVTVAAPTQNATDSNNTRSTGEITHAYVAGDMLGISMTHQSTGPVNSNDKTYVTVVLENDLSDLGY